MSLNLPASMQVPTIGRKVWLWVSLTDTDGYNIKDNSQALDATVVFVDVDGTLTLDVVDHEGDYGSVDNIMLYDYSPEIQHNHDHEFGTVATWMPYQVKKHKEESQQVATASPNHQMADALNSWSAGEVPPLTDGKDV